MACAMQITHPAAVMKRPAGTLLSATEAKAVAPLAFAVGMRMLGLFLLLPVLATYVVGLRDGTVELAGIAIGVYGLTQAFMLAPLGWLSDRIGRKPVLVAGLLLYAAGGLIASGIEHPVMVVVGRAVQGMGAVSAVVMASVADVTRKESRAQGMAIVGLVIALAFGISVVTAVPLADAIGVPGLFLATAVMGVAAAVAVAIAPLPKASAPAPNAHLVDVRVLPPCVAVFAIHYVLAAIFLLLPLGLMEQGLAEKAWIVYLVAFVASVVVAAPMIIKKSTAMAPLLLSSVCVAAATIAVPLAPGAGIVPAIVILAVFFVGFNYLEAVLPTKVSLLVHQGGHGSAMGVYAIAQAAGVFAGGLLFGTIAGTAYNSMGIALGALLALIWIPMNKYLNRERD